jgi:hypothetical protein
MQELHVATPSAVIAQLGVAIAGVAGLTVFVHLLWGRRAMASLTAEDALARFRSEHPEHQALGAEVLEGGDVALIDTETPHTFGVVQAVGAGWTTLVLNDADLASVNADTRGQVRLRTRDFGHPTVKLKFADANRAYVWAAKHDRKRGDG